MSNKITANRALLENLVRDLLTEQRSPAAGFRAARAQTARSRALRGKVPIEGKKFTKNEADDMLRELVLMIFFGAKPSRDQVTNHAASKIIYGATDYSSVAAALDQVKELTPFEKVAFRFLELIPIESENPPGQKIRMTWKKQLFKEINDTCKVYAKRIQAHYGDSRTKHGAARYPHGLNLEQRVNKTFRKFLGKIYKIYDKYNILDDLTKDKIYPGTADLFRGIANLTFKAEEDTINNFFKRYGRDIYASRGQTKDGEIIKSRRKNQPGKSRYMTPKRILEKEVMKLSAPFFSRGIESMSQMREELTFIFGDKVDTDPENPTKADESSRYRVLRAVAIKDNEERINDVSDLFLSYLDVGISLFTTVSLVGLAAKPFLFGARVGYRALGSKGGAELEKLLFRKVTQEASKKTLKQRIRGLFTTKVGLKKFAEFIITIPVGIWVGFQQIEKDLNFKLAELQNLHVQYFKFLNFEMPESEETKKLRDLCAGKAGQKVKIPGNEDQGGEDREITCPTDPLSIGSYWHSPLVTSLQAIGSAISGTAEFISPSTLESTLEAIEESWGIVYDRMIHLNLLLSEVNNFGDAQSSAAVSMANWRHAKKKEQHRGEFIKTIMSIYKDAAKTTDDKKLEEFFFKSVVEINQISKLQERLKAKKKEIQQFADFMTGAAKEIREMTELKSELEENTLHKLANILKEQETNPDGLGPQLKIPTQAPQQPEESEEEEAERLEKSSAEAAKQRAIRNASLRFEHFLKNNQKLDGESITNLRDALFQLDPTGNTENRFVAVVGGEAHQKGRLVDEDLFKKIFLKWVLGKDGVSDPTVVPYSVWNRNPKNFKSGRANLLQLPAEIELKLRQELGLPSDKPAPEKAAAAAPEKAAAAPEKAAEKATEKKTAATEEPTPKVDQAAKKNIDSIIKQIHISTDGQDLVARQEPIVVDMKGPMVLDFTKNSISINEKVFEFKIWIEAIVKDYWDDLQIVEAKSTENNMKIKLSWSAFAPDKTVVLDEKQVYELFASAMTLSAPGQQVEQMMGGRKGAIKLASINKDFVKPEVTKKDDKKKKSKKSSQAKKAQYVEVEKIKYIEPSVSSSARPTRWPGNDNQTWKNYRSYLAFKEGSNIYNIRGGDKNNFDGVFQIGKDAKETKSTRLAKKHIGMDPDSRTAFRTNANAQENAFRNYTAANVKTLKKDFEEIDKVFETPAKLYLVDSNGKKHYLKAKGSDARKKAANSIKVGLVAASHLVGASAVSENFFKNNWQKGQALKVEDHPKDGAHVKIFLNEKWKSYSSDANKNKEQYYFLQMSNISFGSKPMPSQATGVIRMAVNEDGDPLDKLELVKKKGKRRKQLVGYEKAPEQKREVDQEQVKAEKAKVAKIIDNQRPAKDVEDIEDITNFYDFVVSFAQNFISESNMGGKSIQLQKYIEKLNASDLSGFMSSKQKQLQRNYLQLNKMDVLRTIKKQNLNRDQEEKAYDIEERFRIPVYVGTHPLNYSKRKGYTFFFEMENIKSKKFNIKQGDITMIGSRIVDAFDASKPDAQRTAENETLMAEFVEVVLKNKTLLTQYLKKIKTFTNRDIELDGLTIRDKEMYQRYIENFITLIDAGLEAVTNPSSGSTVRRSYDLAHLAAAIYLLPIGF